MREYLDKWRKDNAEKVAKYQAARRTDPTKRERDGKLRKRASYLQKYGMTYEETLQLLDRQGGQCALCSKPLDAGTMNVDHCHTTGVVRGILCTRCNSALGALGDNVAGLEKAIAYLQQAIGVAK